jgi:hypothetical protein
VDASVMPAIVSSKTQALTAMIAENAGASSPDASGNHQQMEHPSSGPARSRPTSATAVQATNATSAQGNPGNTMNRED